MTICKRTGLSCYGSESTTSTQTKYHIYFTSPPLFYFIYIYKSCSNWKKTTDAKQPEQRQEPLPPLSLSLPESLGTAYNGVADGCFSFLFSLILGLWTICNPAHRPILLHTRRQEVGPRVTSLLRH